MSEAMVEMRKEFERRHDFDSSELAVMRQKFMNTFFGDIPEAWIVPIDQTLTKLYEDDPFMIRSVDQYYGYVVLTFREGRKVNDRHREIAKALEMELYDIDSDLHQQTGS